MPGAGEAPIAEKIGYDTCVLPATHDTGSAFLAVPACDLPAVFLSPGTWSLLGRENRSPLTTAAAYGENFTNEGGYHFRYRFLKNIMGAVDDPIHSPRTERHHLRCGREGHPQRPPAPVHACEGSRSEVGFEDLIRAADEAECAGVQASIVNVNDDRFLSPDSMIEEILEACEDGPGGAADFGRADALRLREPGALLPRRRGRLELAGGTRLQIHQHRRGRLPRRPLEPPHRRGVRPSVYAGPVEAPRWATWPCRCSPTGVPAPQGRARRHCGSPSTCRRWNPSDFCARTSSFDTATKANHSNRPNQQAEATERKPDDYHVRFGPARSTPPSASTPRR